jgi:hypothetical protein
MHEAQTSDCVGVNWWRRGRLLYSVVCRQNSSDSVLWPPAACQPTIAINTHDSEDDGADEECKDQTETA